MRQRGVMVGQTAQRLDHRRRRAAARQLIGDPRGRGAVRLGKNDVEGYHRSPGLAEPVSQSGNLAARPRPLTQAANALIVDIDHAHWSIFIGARRGALVTVEQQQAEPVERGQMQQLQRGHQCDQHNPR